MGDGEGEDEIIQHGNHGWLTISEMATLKTLLDRNPDMFVTTELTDTVRILLDRESLHPSTVWRAVKECGFTRKRIRHVAVQRDEELGASFLCVDSHTLYRLAVWESGLTSAPSMAWVNVVFSF